MYFRESDEGNIVPQCFRLFEYVHIQTVQNPLGPIYASYTNNSCDCTSEVHVFKECENPGSFTIEVHNKVLIFHVRNLSMSSPRLFASFAISPEGFPGCEEVGKEV